RAARWGASGRACRPATSIAPGSPARSPSPAHAVGHRIHHVLDDLALSYAFLEGEELVEGEAPLDPVDGALADALLGVCAARRDEVVDDLLRVRVRRTPPAARSEQHECRHADAMSPTVHRTARIACPGECEPARAHDRLPERRMDGWRGSRAKSPPRGDDAIRPARPH